MHEEHVAGSCEIGTRGGVFKGLQEHPRLGEVLELGDEATALLRGALEAHVSNAHAAEGLSNEDFQFLPLDEDYGLCLGLLLLYLPQGVAQGGQLGAVALYLDRLLLGATNGFRAGADDGCIAVLEGRPARRAHHRCHCNRDLVDAMRMEGVGARQHRRGIRCEVFQAHSAIARAVALQDTQCRLEEAPRPHRRDELRELGGAPSELPND
mmetsp:Transcript_72462/g.155174  ORF Transcript_72462/g.155174 Transcript_72462/m.155174 type:complete len:210 (-) Transcript_72462:2521-3150(-)